MLFSQPLLSASSLLALFSLSCSLALIPNGGDCSGQSDSACSSDYCKTLGPTVVPAKLGQCFPTTTSGASLSPYGYRQCHATADCQSAGFCAFTYSSPSPYDNGQYIFYGHCQGTGATCDLPSGTSNYLAYCAYPFYSCIGYRASYTKRNAASCSTKPLGKPCTSNAQCAPNICSSGGVCATPLTPSGALSGKKKARRSNHGAITRSLCPEGFTACPISGSIHSGYECVNLDEELGHCGACGNDCEATASLDQSPTCSAGKCVF